MPDQDKLQITVDALRRNPNLTNEQLAKILGFRQAFSASFYKIKAREILQLEQGKGK